MHLSPHKVHATSSKRVPRLLFILLRRATTEAAPVFDLCAGPDEYALRAMFCYYGQHYHAFIYSEQLALWVMFDDSTVSNVGKWSSVLTKCHTGRIQPLVLFYGQVQALHIEQ